MIFFGHGRSDGKFVELIVKEEKDNLESALRLISKKFKRVGLVGHSLGGLIVTMSARKSDVVVLWAPALMVKEVFTYVFSLDEIIHKLPNMIDALEKKGSVELPTKTWGRDFRGRPFKVGIKFWKDVKSFDSVGNLKNLKCPTLFVQAEGDGSMAIQLNKQAFSATKSKKDFVMFSADHLFHSHYDKLFRLTLKWLDKFL